MSKPYARMGDTAFQKMDKINAELLTLTYGAMVTQLLKDYQDVAIVNDELDKMGYNIGARLVDEFLAKSPIDACANFQETMQVIAAVGLKMFLGVSADVSAWTAGGRECSLTLKKDSNPLIKFVELPAEYAELRYSNVLCGVIRGALDMINVVVTCTLVQSELTGADCTEIRVQLQEIRKEIYKDDDE